MKLISLNIEKRKHLEVVKEFLVSEQPDVVCLQEICEPDVAYFAEALQMESVFEPMCLYTKVGAIEGNAIFAPQLNNVRQHWLAGYEGEDVPTVDVRSLETAFSTMRYMLTVVDVFHKGEVFTVGTTHLPVTDNGEVTEYQRTALKGLLSVLDQYKQIILCGDLNAPRGREVFDVLAEKYTDNIPPECITSLDANIHNDGYIPFVVDALFSTPGYKISDVRLCAGVSDHMAVVAEVERR
jgi:exonuclease III